MSPAAAGGAGPGPFRRFATSLLLKDCAMPHRSFLRRLGAWSAALVLSALAGCGSGDLYQSSGTQAFDPTTGENGGSTTPPAETPDEILTVEVLGVTSKAASVSDDQDGAVDTAFLLPAVSITPGEPQELSVEVVDAVGRTVRRTVVVSVSQ